MAIVGTEHLNFNNPPIWIPLFDVQISAVETLYLTSNFETVSADGNDYIPFPIYLEELQENSKGDVPSVRLICSNLMGELASAIKTNGSLDGYTITYKIYSTYTEQTIYEEQQEILKTGPITNKTITLELGLFNPYNLKLLTEKFLKNFCWNTYKGKGCWIKDTDGTYIQPSGTTFSASTCGKTLDDCRDTTRGNLLRFNSFPTLSAKLGRFV